MKEKMNCYSCLKELTKYNISNEHIIPNAIGGKIKSQNLLCIKCNNEFGHKYEGQFIEQLRFFSGRLPIKRDRGVNKSFFTIDKKSGLPVFVDDEGKITLARTFVDKNLNSQKIGTFKIMAPNLESAEKVIKGFKNKYPEAKITTEIQNQELKPTDYIEIEGGFGGTGFFKTVQKCFTNFYIHEGRERKHIEEEVKKLFSTEDEARVWFLSDAPALKSVKRLSHVLAIFGRPEESLLFGYAEFFGGIRLLGILNSDYNGPTFSSVHSIDPLSGEVNDCQVNVNINRVQILEIVDKKELNIDGFIEQLDLAERAVKDNHYFSNIINEVFKNTLFNEKNIGEAITPEIMNEIAYELGNALMPNIAAACEKRRKEAEEEFRKNILKKTDIDKKE